ncbi:MAG: FHA domain-containing protein [Chloroflexota bacterium]
MQNSNIHQLENQILDQYVLNKYLGMSGPTHVFQATDPTTNKPAHVHMLPNHQMHLGGFVPSFLEKAKKLQLLRHDNIIHTSGFGVGLGYPYLVTPVINGSSLQNLISTCVRRSRRIPMDAVIFIATSITTALAEGHRSSLSHGNLKADQVVLERDGAVLLSSFGFTSLLKFEEETKSDIFGHYQLIRDQQRDIFELGMVLYTVLTLKSPYEFSDIVESSTVEDLPANLNPTAPIKLIPETPVELNRLVMRMIAPKIADRYQAIREVQKDLKFLSSQSRTTSLPSVQLTSVAQYSSRFANVIIPEANAIPIQKQIALYFVDTGQVLELDNSKDYTIGRKSKGQSVVPDIDMTPFKAYEWGISRMHAGMSTKEGKVRITDKGSANGTWHAGKRIAPDTPYELHDGDIFMLGKLRIQVLIPEEAF